MEPVPQRIGDAERDRAVAALRDHHAAGRLSLDEFDERMQTALSARVTDDLTPLFADLPRDPNQSLEFLPGGTAGTGLALTAAAPLPELWTDADETELARLDRLDRIYGFVHLIGWPAIILINFLVDWKMWFLFPLFGVVFGSIHGNVSERRDKLKKRRKKAIIAANPELASSKKSKKMKNTEETA